jgi:hypothetical protein
MERRCHLISFHKMTRRQGGKVEGRDSAKVLRYGRNKVRKRESSRK